MVQVEEKRLDLGDCKTKRFFKEKDRQEAYPELAELIAACKTTKYLADVSTGQRVQGLGLTFIFPLFVAWNAPCLAFHAGAVDPGTCRIGSLGVGHAIDRLRLEMSCLFPFVRHQLTRILCTRTRGEKEYGKVPADAAPTAKGNRSSGSLRRRRVRYSDLEISRVLKEPLL